MAVGIVNTAMVGSLGASAIASVGLANRLVQTSWALYQAIGIGTTVMIAQMIGAGDESMTRQITRQALVLAVMAGTALAAVCAGFSRPLLLAVGASPDVLATGVPYMVLLSLGLPFYGIMIAVGAALRGAGDTRTPMQVALVVNIVNVIGNSLLIFGRSGFPALGVTGSAVATVTAQAVGAVLAMLALRASSSRVSTGLRGPWGPDPAWIKRILNVGLPSAGENFFWQAAAIILTSLVSSFGTVALAAHQLGLQAESISYMPAAGFSIAATTLVGQATGARDASRASRYVREIALWCGGLTAFTAGILFFCRIPLLGIFTPDTNVVMLGADYLVLMAMAQIPQQLTSVYGGALRGSGDTRTPMAIAAVGVWLVRIPLSFYFSRALGLGIHGVWMAMTADLFARYLLMMVLYHRSPLRLERDAATSASTTPSR